MNKKEQIQAKKTISNLIGDSYMPAEIILSLNDIFKLMQEYHEVMMKERECDHPFASVHTRCMGEINTCLKCGKDLGPA